ncbi:MAG: bifunctional hydroxymethylpyrimidine kinase/phosphomethylpyrimidine kinase [Gammaproteobacteria bacterium]
MKKVLSIAGSDSGGGAGIQADLKAITLLGGYGMSVVTALTAQNTVSVRAIQTVTAEFIDAQLEAVLSDIGADAVKTGMLATAEIVHAVAAALRRHPIERLVVDPVMIAKGGERLLAEKAETTLQRELLPLAYVVTPNLPEAESLCGFPVRNLEEMKHAAARLHELGPHNVLIKGGHLSGNAVDLLFDGRDFQTFESPRIPTSNTHGTGCTYSAAIATLLAQGHTLKDAVAIAKDFVTRAIGAGFPLGAGHGPTNPFVWISRQLDRPRVLTALDQAYETLANEVLGWIIPEVRSNFGYAIEGACGREDVAAFPGRLTEIKNRIIAVRRPEFGGSRHIARVILAAMRHCPELRSAINIRYTADILEACRRCELRVASFSRTDEPAEVKRREGSTLEWGTEHAFSGCTEPPDVVYDEGEIGKEPMIRLFGKTPDEVVDKLKRVAKQYLNPAGY